MNMISVRSPEGKEKLKIFFKDFARDESARRASWIQPRDELTV
ncbi:MAG: hypothetical protein N2C14_08960 [Planctomycetales bacterium]